MDSSQLINNLKMRGSFPASDDLFSTSDFLLLLNNQLQTDMTPLMLSLNEEYFLQTKDYSISTTGATYRFPRRAVGSKARDLKVVDSGGNYYSLDRLFEEDRPSNKSGYYMKRNGVELTPDFNSGTLRLVYFSRPNELVATTACAQITSIDTGNNQVDVSSVPSTMTDGVLCDFIQGSNPYDLLDYDRDISSIAGNTITFTSLPDGLEVGDWIALATQSPVPMLPEELHPVLVQSALCAALSSKKDKVYDQEMVRLQEMKDAAIKMLDPRVENDSIKFRSGALLGFLGSRRW